MLGQEEARALWQRFSAYMDEHRNDFDGFARSEGFAFASVGAQGGRATLTLSNEREPTRASRAAPSGANRGPRPGSRQKQRR